MREGNWRELFSWRQCCGAKIWNRFSFGNPKSNDFCSKALNFIRTLSLDLRDHVHVVNDVSMK